MSKKIKLAFELQGTFFEVRNGYSFPVLGVIFNDHNCWKYEQRYDFYGFRDYQLRQIADKIEHLNSLSFEELQAELKQENTSE